MLMNSKHSPFTLKENKGSVYLSSGKMERRREIANVRQGKGGMASRVSVNIVQNTHVYLATLDLHVSWFVYYFYWGKKEDCYFLFSIFLRDIS